MTDSKEWIDKLKSSIDKFDLASKLNRQISDDILESAKKEGLEKRVTLCEKNNKFPESIIFMIEKTPLQKICITTKPFKNHTSCLLVNFSKITENNGQNFFNDHLLVTSTDEGETFKFYFQSLLQGIHPDGMNIIGADKFKDFSNTRVCFLSLISKVLLEEAVK